MKSHNKLSRLLLQSALALAITAACSSLAVAGNGRGNAGGNGNGNGGDAETEVDRPGRGNSPDFVPPGQDPDFVPPGQENRPTNPGNGNGGGNGDGGGDDDDDGNGNGNGNGRGHLNRGNTSVCEGEDPIEGPAGQSGNSHVAHINFGAVDPVTGEATDEDAWARLMYFWIGSEFSFVLNAHKVEPGSAWTLVAALEGDAGDEAVCLGSGTANNGGQLHINANFDPESNLPADFDPFADDEGEGGDDEGTVELQLVPSDTVDCETGVVTPDTETETVLASDGGIRFVDTDELVCPDDDAEEG